MGLAKLNGLPPYRRPEFNGLHLRVRGLLIWIHLTDIYWLDNLRSRKFKLSGSHWFLQTGGIERSPCTFPLEVGERFFFHITSSGSAGGKLELKSLVEAHKPCYAMSSHFAKAFQVQAELLFFNIQ
jgi:hypothetical protein